MKVRPLHDRILVRRIEEEGKTKGGLIIPDTAKEKPMQGNVIAVGKGRVQEDGKVRPLDSAQGRPGALHQVLRKRDPGRGR